MHFFPVNVVIHFCDGFSASLFQSSVAYDLSEVILICWFAAQELFLIIISVEICLIFIVEIMETFSRMNRKFKIT